MGRHSAESSVSSIQRELATREQGFPSPAYAAYIGALLSRDTRTLNLIGLTRIPGLVQSPATSRAMARQADTIDPRRSETLRNALSDYWQRESGTPTTLLLSTEVLVDAAQARHLLTLEERSMLSAIRFFRPTQSQINDWGKLTVVQQVHPANADPWAYVEYDEAVPKGMHRAPDECYVPNMPGTREIERVIELAEANPMTRDQSARRLHILALGQAAQ